ncbi:hypothetical protein ACHAQA_010043 [Verticillium albo-atrum]
MHSRYFISIATSALLLLTLAAIPAQGQKDGDLDGTLAWVDDGPFFTFEYSTSVPNDTNRIGIWRTEVGGPVNGESAIPPSLTEYAPEANGTVEVSTDGLPVGNYTAYFLARDGFDLLASPVNVTLPLDINKPVSFFVDDVALTNGRQGDEYLYSIAGFIKDGNPEDVKFSKSACSGHNSDWVQVALDGIVTGTPPADAVDAIFSVIVESNGKTAVAHFTISIRQSDQNLTENLRIMSLNLFYGGILTGDAREKQARAVLASGADVVGLQEDFSGQVAPILAQALGWYYWSANYSVAVVSRYPFAEEYGVIFGEDASLEDLPEIFGTMGGVHVSVDKKNDLSFNFFFAHLTSFPYGPHAFCHENKTAEEVMAIEEESERPKQITEGMEKIKPYLDGADDVPVFLVGDFNAPSHLDWVPGLADLHCGVKEFQWPSSYIPQQAGLLDSFRVKYPNPVAEPGLTWSPVVKVDVESQKPEPQDRIDFVYHKGSKLRVCDSKTFIIGKPSEAPDVWGNEWPSDHKAVLTEYVVSW